MKPSTQRIDEQMVAAFASENPNISIQDAFMAGLTYERRAAARLAFSINDAMAHTIGRLIRSRGHDANRKQYE
jgi:hypothetical protein